MAKDSKNYINVPFVEKDKAKALGARWDPKEKSWYYTNPNNSYLFSKWAKPAKVRLSKEQGRLIKLVKEGKNVLVDACIGSGKTTTIQALCNKLPKSKKILYLTYNRLLKIDAKEKIKNKNVFVQNYHGFAYVLLKEISVTVGMSDLIQTFLKKQKELNIPKYDILIIDEYQDIEQELAEMLLLVKEKNPKIQIVAVGDMKQKIYDKTTLNVAEFMDNFLDIYVPITFTKCFRLSKTLSKKLGNVWNKEINGVNDNCQIAYMNPPKVIKFLSTQNTKDILCLGSRTGTMSKVLNELEEKYPDKFNKDTVYASIKDEDRGSVSPNDSTAIFTTFDSSKGLERKICVIFDYTEHYWQSRIQKPNTKYEILRNIFLVAASRGKEKIVFVEDMKQNPETGAWIEEKTPVNMRLSLNTISHPTAETLDYNRPFVVSEMYSFKYKEDVEACFNLVEVEEIMTKDRTTIGTKNNDKLIDLSPCIGILQEATFFTKYDIDSEIKFAQDNHKDRPKINLPIDATLEDKVLYLTAYNTGYDRYVNQVKTPFVSEETLGRIQDRLRQVFKPSEEVQRSFSISFKLPEKDDDGNYKKITINGRSDVIKNNIVYELKFEADLMHEDFLQCATYMVAFNLEKGILWNVKKNRMYIITIPDRKVFISQMMKTITKGCVTKFKIPKNIELELS